MGRVSGLCRFDGVDDLAMMKNESSPFASWSLGKVEWAGEAKGWFHGRHQHFKEGRRLAEASAPNLPPEFVPCLVSMNQGSKAATADTRTAGTVARASGSSV